MGMWPIKEYDLGSFHFEVEDPGEPVPVISRYTSEDAVEDGILVPLRDYTGPEEKPVYMTQNLFCSEGYVDDPDSLRATVELGFDLLKLPDVEDEYSATKLRVLEKGRKWVIEDGSSVTYMRPEDY